MTQDELDRDIQDELEESCRKLEESKAALADSHRRLVASLAALGENLKVIDGGCAS